MIILTDLDQWKPAFHRHEREGQERSWRVGVAWEGNALYTIHQVGSGNPVGKQKLEQMAYVTSTDIVTCFTLGKSDLVARNMHGTISDTRESIAS